MRCEAQINKANGMSSKLSRLLVASPLSILPEGSTRGVFRSNDPTNIRRPSIISWYPCRDVWLEALERLTLSFCLIDPRSHMWRRCAAPDVVARCSAPPFLRVPPPPSSPSPGFLTAISSDDFKSLGRVAVYQERRIVQPHRGHARFPHTCTRARARERETIGKFDFPGRLMLLW